MLDWIFEGIVTWISSVVSDMMDAVSGLFLQALGTDMTAMEEYFPFVSKAFRFLYKGIIIKHNKTEPTYTKTSLFLCEKRRFFMGRTEKGGKVF